MLRVLAVIAGTVWGGALGFFAGAYFSDMRYSGDQDFGTHVLAGAVIGAALGVIVGAGAAAYFVP